MVPLLDPNGGLLPYNGGLIHPDDDGLLPLRRAAIQQLLGLDYTSPTQQAFPTTAAAMTSLGLPAPLAICLFDEASGPIVDEVGAESFTNSGSPQYERKAVGFYDGTDTYSKKSIYEGEFTASTGSTYFDHDGTESFAIFMVVRSGKGVGGASSGGICKKLSTRGIDMQWRSGGDIIAKCHGDTTVSVTYNSEEVDDGAWHGILIVVDRDANTLKVFGEGGSATGTPPTGTLANAASLRFGGVNGWDIAYSALWEGSGVEGMGATEHALLWTHATDPGTGGIFPTLDTYTRASLACPIVGNESGFGDRVAKFASGQFAAGWDTDFTHTSKLGLLIEEVATNLCLQSEDVTTTWTNTNTTDAANSAEAPDGTQTADTVTATAADGIIDQASIVTAAATEYTMSVWVKRNGGSNVSGRIVMYDNTGTAEIGGTVFTATDEWVRYTHTGTTAAGQIDTSFRLEIDTDTESVFVWGFQMEAGAYASSYIPTTSAAATRNATDCQLTNTGGTLYGSNNKGEAQAVFAMTVDVDVARPVFDVNNASDSTDRVWATVLAGGTTRVRLYDDVAALKQNITVADPGNWDQEHTIRFRWDSDDGVDGNSENGDIILDGARTAGSVATWGEGTTATTIQLGGSLGGGQLNGVLATLDVYDAPRAA